MVVLGLSQNRGPADSQPIILARLDFHSTNKCPQPARIPQDPSPDWSMYLGHEPTFHSRHGPCPKFPERSGHRPRFYSYTEQGPENRRENPAQARIPQQHSSGATSLEKIHRRPKIAGPTEPVEIPQHSKIYHLTTKIPQQKVASNNQKSQRQDITNTHGSAITNRGCRSAKAE